MWTALNASMTRFPAFPTRIQVGSCSSALMKSPAIKWWGVYDPQDLQKKVTEQCNQMEPPVRAVFTLAEWKENVWICSAEIPSLDLSERPGYYKGVGRLKGAFLRVGDADLPMTEYELYSFEAFRKHHHDDERPCRACHPLHDGSIKIGRLPPSTEQRTPWIRSVEPRAEPAR